MSFPDSRPRRHDRALALVELRSDLTYIRLLLADLRLHLVLKAGFNSDQPRDDHGRWTDTGSFDDTMRGLLDELDDGNLLQDVAYPG